ncbi:MAG: molybdopterin-dependent oxidoreductase, partial [Gammaproteobacteria bacterium]|nr:molybdopterin-dependent oxidoreductase [Gammaproteobacteria bacterium]
MKVDLQTSGLAFDNGPQEVAEFDIHSVREKPIVWDAVNKITHDANCGQQLQCALNAFVWKGVVLKEEQTGNYRPPNDPDCPDHNPRGCQKGLCWSQNMYAPTRIKHPYKRAGERGEGKWQRISWDQALKEIADKILDTMIEYGPKTIINGVGLEGGAQSGVPMLLAGGAGTPTMPQLNTEIADDQDGALEMFGNSSFGDSIDNWYYADILVVWCSNPSYTQMTNYHYITEARYNGTEVWVINADYSASSIPADLWVPVKPGSDAALFNGICQVLIEENLHKEDFIKEQSDQPMLIRTDNGKYLRETDRVADGRDYVFYMYDEATSAVVEAPFKNLNLGDIKPALEGEWEVDTLEGPVTVTTVFSDYKKMLNDEYTPEQAGEMCGVHADTIRMMARKMAKANGVCQASATYGVGKYYHGNLMQRAMASAWVLTGHIGRKGAGISAMGGILSVESESAAPAGKGGMDMPELDPAAMQEWGEREFGPYRMKKEVFGMLEKDMLNSSALFYWLHAGLLELSKENNSFDPHLKRTVEEYWNEAMDSGERGVYPPEGTDPKIMFVSGGDPVRRIRSNQHVIETLFPKLDMILVSDVRWNATSRWADYVLPACGYYERTSVRAVSVVNSPFAHLTVKSSEPLYESRSDYWQGVMICKAISDAAKERGIETITCKITGKEYAIQELGDRATAWGAFTEDDDEAVAAHAYNTGKNIDLPDWEKLKKRGWAEFTGLGENVITAQEFAGEVSPGDPWVPLTWHTDKKEIYTTLTGRIQFYIDHDWFLELGESHIVHKESIKGGGDYPIQLIGG